MIVEIILNMININMIIYVVKKRIFLELSVSIIMIIDHFDVVKWKLDKKNYLIIIIYVSLRNKLNVNNVIQLL